MGIVIFCGALIYFIFNTSIINRYYSLEIDANLSDKTNLYRNILYDALNEKDFRALQKLLKKINNGGKDKSIVIFKEGPIITSDRGILKSDKTDYHRKKDVIDAFAGQKTTLKTHEDFFYVTTPLVVGRENDVVIRSAIDQRYILETFNEIRIVVIFATIFVLFLAAVALWLYTRKITNPLKRLENYAKNLAKDNLNITFDLKESDSHEVFSLATSLNAMAKELHNRFIGLARKRNEQEVVFSSMKEGVLMLDQKSRVILFNPAFTKVFKMSDHHKGEPLSDSHLPKKMQQIILKLQKNANSYSSVEYQSEEYNYLISVAPYELLKREGGTREGALFVFNDISELRKLEGYRRDFVGNVSHELRTPLTNIEGFIKPLQRGEVTDPEQVKKFLTIIRKNVSRLKQMIFDLLALSEIEKNENEIRKEKVYIEDLVHNAIDVCTPKAKKQNIAIDYTVSPEKTLVNVNNYLIEQAILNVIDNAIKYCPEGSIIKIKLTSDKNFLKIDIVDNGPGISLEHQERIFERFYSVDKARSRKLGGTGLGLSLVKHIINVHQGTIELESTEGQGCKFIITLPCENINGQD